MADNDLKAKCIPIMIRQIKESDQPGREPASICGSSSGLAARLWAIGGQCAGLPDLDARTPEEIVGYDETGLWR